jgi:hypothetical protein
MHGEFCAAFTRGKYCVFNLPAPIGRNLFSHSLPDLAIAGFMARQTDHTDRRRDPWASGLR